MEKLSTQLFFRKAQTCTVRGHFVITRRLISIALESFFCQIAFFELLKKLTTQYFQNEKVSAQFFRNEKTERSVFWPALENHASISSPRRHIIYLDKRVSLNVVSGRGTQLWFVALLDLH